MKEQNCWECRFFNPGEKCLLINHPLENGLAMQFHSQRCDVNNLYDGKYYKALNKLVQEHNKGNKILFLGTHVDNDINNLFVHKDVDMITIVEPNVRFIGYFKKTYKNATIINEQWDSFHADNKFDTILCLDALEHITNPEKVMARLQLLTDNIIISVPNPMFKFIDANIGIDHGHGPHVSFIDKKRLKSMFNTESALAKLSTKDWTLTFRPIRRLGPFSAGIFLCARRLHEL